MAIIKNLYRKSILFEIVNIKNPSRPVEAFTLTVPPESVEIEEPQRIARTKTFGGLWEDDYGPDNLKINISGNTGGSDLRKTYVPPSLAASVPSEFSGKSAFYHFRDRIMRYKDTIGNYSEYELRIYDLSTAPDLAKTSPIYQSFGEGYVVSLDKFKLTRNKDRPLYYNYTIELIAKRSLGQPSLEERRKPPALVEDPQRLIENVKKAAKVIRAFFAKVRDIQDKADNVLEVADHLSAQLYEFYRRTMDMVTYPASLARRVLHRTKELTDAIDNLGESWTETVGIVVEDYYSMILVAQEAAASAAALVTRSKTFEAAGKAVIHVSSDPTSAEAPAKRYAGLTPEEQEIPAYVLDSVISERESIDIYGHVLVLIDDTVSLEKLAADYYGNPSYQELIASYNGIEDINDLEAGSTIKVPVLMRGDLLTGNLVYSESLIDVYGSDIKLDEGGNPVIGESGDYIAVEGIANIIQALNLRLNQSLGTRLRLTIYGIRSSIGSAVNIR